jgi:hypothetical protein
MNRLSQCHYSHWPYGGMCPQFNPAFSLEEAPNFGRGSSLNRSANDVQVNFPDPPSRCHLPFDRPAAYGNGARLKAQAKQMNTYYGAQGTPKIIRYHCLSGILMVDFWHRYHLTVFNSRMVSSMDMVGNTKNREV